MVWSCFTGNHGSLPGKEGLYCLQSDAPPDVVAQRLTRTNAKGETVFHACAAQLGGIVQLTQLCRVSLLHWKLLIPLLRKKAHLSEEGAAATLAALLDVTDHQGRTALYVACSCGHMEEARLLLEQGANPWLSDNKNAYNALHQACLKGRMPVVKLLLVDLPDQWQLSPTDHVTRLVNSRTATGFTPLHCAIAGADASPFTMTAVLGVHPWITLYNEGPGLDPVLNYPPGTTALHIAAARGDTNAAQALLFYFAEHALHRNLMDPRPLCDGTGARPFHIAAEKGHMVLARLLHPDSDLDCCEELGLSSRAVSVPYRASVHLAPIGESHSETLAAHPPLSRQSMPHSHSLNTYVLSRAPIASVGMMLHSSIAHPLSDEQKEEHMRSVVVLAGRIRSRSSLDLDKRCVLPPKRAATFAEGDETEQGPASAPAGPKRQTSG